MLANGIVTVTRWAPQVTFTTANWWMPVTVTLAADAGFVLAPGATSLKTFAKRPHVLDGLQGPLQVEGGTTTAGRSLQRAFLLPGETNAPFFGIPPQPSEATQVDVLNVYADSSVENLIGQMSSTSITGLGMSAGLNFGAQGFTQTAFGESLVIPGGISFGTISIDGSGRIVSDGGLSTIEVVNLMLGEGNDTLTITGTLSRGRTRPPTWLRSTAASRPCTAVGTRCCGSARRSPSPAWTAASTPASRATTGCTG